jgi:hypothetical protein
MVKVSNRVRAFINTYFHRRRWRTYPVRCERCGTSLEVDGIGVVSRAGSKVPKRYCIDCADILNIVDKEKWMPLMWEEFREVFDKIFDLKAVWNKDRGRASGVRLGDK